MLLVKTEKNINLKNNQPKISKSGLKPHKQCEVNDFCEYMTHLVLFLGFIFKYILHSYICDSTSKMCVPESGGMGSNNIRNDHINCFLSKKRNSRSLFAD